MAAKTIKGITVEINGDVTGLGKALKEVESNSQNLQSTLKKVDSALKLDPTNTELLTEKQKLLNDAVNETRRKLETLESVQEQVEQQYADGEIGQAAYIDFQKEIVYTREKLESLEAEQKEFSGVVEQNMKVASQKFSEFGDKIQSAGGKISDVGGKISDVGKKASVISAAIVGAGTAAVNLGSDLEESQNKVSVAFEDSADKVFDFAETTLDSYGIAKGTALDMAALFGDMGTSMGLPKEEAAAMSTALVGLAGDLASFKNIDLDTAQTALKGIFTGETESLKNLGVVMTQDNLLAYALSNGFLDTSKSAAELEKQQIAVEKAQNAYNAAVSKYGSGSLEAREAALKLSEAQTALTESGSASLDNLTAAEKVQLRYAYVMDQTTNAQGDFANTSDSAANSLRVAHESVKEMGASFGTLLTPYVAEAAQWISDLIKKITALPEEEKKQILMIAAIVAAIGPVLTITGTLVSGVGSVISIVGQLASPVGIAVAVIGGLVAIFVKAYQSCDWFREGVDNVISSFLGFCEDVKTAWPENFFSDWGADIKDNWDGLKSNLGDLKDGFIQTGEKIRAGWDTAMTAVQSVSKQRLDRMKQAYEENGGGLKGVVAATMSGIEGLYTDGWRVVDTLTGGKLTALKDTIATKMNEAKQKVSDVIDKIKEKFNFEWKWPKLKLPHFTATGSFSLNPPSVPKFDIAWYAKGGILDGAQIFGQRGSTLLAGGEAGKEAVLPLTEFYRELESILSRNPSGASAGGLVVNVNIDHFENTRQQDITDLSREVAQELYFEFQRSEAALA